MITPEPRYRRDTDTEDATSVPEVCPGCANTEAQYRSNHHLSLAAFEGLDGLRFHLRKQYVTLRDVDKKRPDLVDDICAWVADLMSLYGGLAHPETGAPMSWAEARHYCATQGEAMAARAFERAPTGYTWQPRERDDWLKAALLKYAPVTNREPGEDRLEDI